MLEQIAFIWEGTPECQLWMLLLLLFLLFSNAGGCISYHFHYETKIGNTKRILQLLKSPCDS